MHLINLYAPNGNTPDTHPLGTEKFNYKLTWLDALYQRTKELRTQRIPFLLGGDFNIIPKAIDARHPEQWINDALYQPQSHAAWQSLINTGMIDAYRALYPKQEHAYTFWDYQAGAWPRDNGIRIDHFLLSPPLADRLDKVWIDKTPRAAEKPSDHTVLALSLS
jgi:exodeoxyribonuclease-3